MEARYLEDNWRYQAPVVVSAAVSMGVGVGLYQYVGSLFVESLQAEYGFTRGQISTGHALAFLGAASAPLVGTLTDRFGVSRIAASCAALVGLGFTGLALMTGALWQFLVLMGLIGIVAPGTTSLICSRPVIDRFVRHRGLALGLVTSGLSLSALLLAPLVRTLIDRHGADGGYWFLAFLAFAIGVPLLPSALRLRPMARRESRHLPNTPANSEGINRRLFWHIGAVMALVNIPASGLLAQLAVLLTDQGYSATRAATMVSVFSASVLIGRITIGWLIDRIPARYIAASVTMIAAIGCILLGQNDLVAIATLAVIAIGLMQGGESDILGYLVGCHFPEGRFGRVYGSLFTISLIASALGVAGFGRLYDAHGSYDSALWLSSGMLLLAGIGYVCLPKSRTTITA